MRRWLVAAAFGWSVMVGASLHAQPVVHSFHQPASWFVGPVGETGVSRGPITPIGSLGVNQIAVDRTHDGIVDAIYDLPPDVRNDTQSPPRWTLEDRLSPTQRVLYTRKFPRDSSSPAVCGGSDTANSEIFFHRLDTPPGTGMTLLGSACLRAPFSRQPLFFDPPTTAPRRTAMIVAAPTAGSQAVGWFDLAAGGQGTDGVTYESNVEVAANGVLVSPFGNAFYVRHRTSQQGQAARYTIVDLCASPTGGAVTTRDVPGGAGQTTVQHRIDGSDLSAVVSFAGLPSPTPPFPLENCFGGPPAVHHLAVSVSGAGAVSSTPAGITCGVPGGVCDAAFLEGTTVTLAALPFLGATFLGWSGDCSGTASTAQVLMDQDRACTASFGSVQLAISKTATPTPAMPGETLTYRLSYSNAGNLDATGVVVSDRLPSGSTFVAAPNGTLAGSTVTWNVGTLAAGASGQVELLVRPSCQASLANSTYFIDSAQTPPRAGAPLTTPVNSPSTSPVTVVMTSAPDRLPLRSGDRITHTLTLTNTGSAGHARLRTRFGIGDAVAFDAVVAHGTGTLTPVSPLDLEWIGTLAAGATTSVVFTTIVVDCFTVDETRFNGLQPVAVENACGQVMGSVTPPGPFALERPIDVGLEFVGLPAGRQVVAHPGAVLDLRITLTNRFTAGQPDVSVATVIPASLVLAANPPFVPPSDPAAAWDPATRTVSWNGSVPGNGTVTITVRGTLDPAGPCRAFFEVAGTRGGCADLRRGLFLYSVPPSPGTEHILAVDVLQGLYRWEPGVDRNYREVLCTGSEFFAGVDRTPAGDVWLAGLPSLRLNPDTPVLEVPGPGFLGTPAAPSHSTNDVAHDPTTGTLVFAANPGSLKRYDPANGQVTDLTTQGGFRVMIEPDGTIATADGQALYRHDPASPGNPQVLSSPGHRFPRFAVALGADGKYVAAARRTGNPPLEDLIEIDPATGSFTPILSDTHAHTGALPGDHGPVIVAPDGAIYLGHPGVGDEISRIDRSSGTPVVTRLSTIGTTTNPATPGVSRIRLMDFVFVPEPPPAASADLAVAKNAAIPEVTAGTNLSYQVTVTNNGPAAAAAVQMVDGLPAGVVLVAAAPSQGTCAGNVVCDLGVLSAGSQATIAVVVRVGPSTPASSVLTNTASVNSATPDPIAANDTASVATPVVTAADLAISKTAPSGSVEVGTPLRYDLLVVNGGPSDASGIVVTDPLPAGVTYDAAASSPSCAESGGTVTCAVATLPPGASAALAIVVNPTQAGVLLNTASVTSATPDPQAGNDTSSLTVVVTEPGAGENVDPTNAGEQYAYGENVGWLNLEPLGDGGPGVEVRGDGLGGWMWSENTGWCSLSCENTSSCPTAGYGVTNDGAGVLSGQAWCENIGWLSFSCASTGSCGTASYGVTIDPATGVFAGNAWGENVGWITFGSPGPVPYRIVTGWRGAPAAGPSR